MEKEMKFISISITIIDLPVLVVEQELSIQAGPQNIMTHNHTL